MFRAGWRGVGSVNWRGCLEGGLIGWLDDVVIEGMSGGHLEDSSRAERRRLDVGFVLVGRLEHVERCGMLLWMLRPLFHLSICRYFAYSNVGANFPICAINLLEI